MGRPLSACAMTFTTITINIQVRKCVTIIKAAFFFQALVLLPDPFHNRVTRFRPNDNDICAYYMTHLNDYVYIDGQ